MQKKYFCVQKKQAITSELSEFLLRDYLRHKPKCSTFRTERKKRPLRRGAALDFPKKRFPAKAKA